MITESNTNSHNRDVTFMIDLESNGEVSSLTDVKNGNHVPVMPNGTPEGEQFDHSSSKNR